MVSAFTTNKKIEQPAFNDYVNSWDVPVNADWAIIDKAFGGVGTVNLTGLSGSQVLTQAQYQPLKIAISGGPTANTNLVVPTNIGGLWVVRNDTTGGFAISISSAAGGSLITVPVGTNTLVTCDGSAVGMFLAINTAPVAGGTNTQVQYNNSGVLGGSADMTWDGTKITTTGLNVTGNTVLGDAAGDTLTINGTALSAPNGLNFNTNQLRLGASPYNQVMINAATPYGSSTMTVGGAITSTAGGYYFPDGTLQTTATILPPGTVMAYAGPNVPSGWFPCDGRSLSRAAFPGLFNAIGGYYGVPDANTFNIPNLFGRVIAMIDPGYGILTGNTINNPATWGGVGGQEREQAYADVTTAGRSYGANSSQLSVHVYGNTSNESHGVNGLQFGGGGYAADGHSHWTDWWFNTEGSMSVYADGNYSGGGWVRLATNVQPTMTMYYIIKA